MEYTGSPHTGKTARLWKVIYEDGEKVGKEQINDSYYKKSDQIIEAVSYTHLVEAAQM